MSCKYKDERVMKELLELDVLDQHAAFNALKASAQTYIQSPEAGEFHALDEFDNTLENMLLKPSRTRFTQVADQIQPSAQMNLI